MRTRSAARAGRNGLELRYDFRNGGRYVQAGKSLRYRREVRGIRFWVRGSQDVLLALRARDREGQVFQRMLGRVGTSWSELRVSFADWTDAWGGRNDGVPRWPASAVAIVVMNSGAAPSGAIYIDQVRRWRPPSGGAPAAQPLAEHPRLLIAARDVPSLRTRARTDPRAASICARIASHVRMECKGGLRLPERGGQCKHWYVCPTHGCRLGTDGPERHRCPIDGRTFSGWPYDDVALAYEHDRLARLARDAGLLWVAASDSSALRMARSILLSYADRYRSYRLHDIHGRGSRGARVHAQSLDEAVWLVTMAQAADLVWRELSVSERVRLRDRLFLPAIEDVVRPGRMAIHNIQCWHNAAIGLVGYLLGDRDLIYEAVDGPVGFREQLRRGLTPDGMWSEGSWGYHFYALRALVALSEAAANSGESLYGRDLLGMLRAPITAAMPDGTLPAINDSSRVALAEQDVYEVAYARYREPALAVPLRRSARRSVEALVHGSRLPSQEPPRRANPRVLEGSGMAILEGGEGTSASWVCVKYGPHGGGHGHYDKNGLVAYAEGDVLLDDAGIGPHLSPLATEWYKTTAAHNTVGADEMSQRAATGSLVAFETGPRWAASMTDAGPAISGVRFVRSTFLLDDEVLVVLDLLSAQDGRDRVFDAFWHPNGRLGGMPPGTPVMPAGAPGYRHITALRSHPMTHGTFGATITTPRGSRRLVLSSLPASGATVTAGSGPVGAVRGNAPVVWVRQKGERTLFAMAMGLKSSHETLMLTHPAARGRLDADTAAVVVRSGARAWLLVANPDDGPVVVKGRTYRQRLAVTPLGPQAH